MKVHIRHLRAARQCSRGGRQWFEAHGLSWSDFVANGIDAEILEATGDPMAAKTVEIARSE